MKSSLIALAVFASVVAADAVERGDLSEASRAILPADAPVTMTLNNGTVLQGQIVSRTATEVLLKQTKGGITSQFAYPVENIKKIEEQSLCDTWAKALKARPFDPAIQLEAAAYAQEIQLYKEFAELCPRADGAAELTARHASLTNDLANLNAGRSKVGGVWLPPVAAAVRRFDMYTEQIAKVEARFPGIQAESYPANPRAKQAYNQIEQQRRDVARELPKTVTGLVPTMIEQRQFDLAAEEAHAFMTFWITRVIRTEAGRSDSQKLQQVLEGMDFNYITRLEEQIAEAWRASVTNQPVVTPPGLATNEVYVPGGYFLMGGKTATIADDTFPFRLVYVSPFVLSKYEVSNAEYRKFVDHVRATGDSSMEHPGAPPLKDHAPEGWKFPDLNGDNQPVVGVDWFDAYAFATWKGCRLPTEAEWEFAARASDGRAWPWGDDTARLPLINAPKGRNFIASEVTRLRPPPPQPKESSSLFGKSNEPSAPPPVTLSASTWNIDMVLPPEAPSDYFPDTSSAYSPFGVLHMSGNAAEWVADVYGKDYYQTAPLRNPTGPEAGQDHVLRGGSYLSDDRELATYWRGVAASENERNGLHASGRPVAGIRLARSLPLATP